MKTATISSLRSHLSDYINQTEPVVVTQQGRPKAVLVPIENEDDMERLLLASHAGLSKLLKSANSRISRTGGIPHDEFWALVGDSADQKKKNSKRKRR